MPTIVRSLGQGRSGNSPIGGVVGFQHAWATRVVVLLALWPFAGGMATAEVLCEALAVGASQLVPFLFKTGASFQPEGHEYEFYSELCESRLYFDLEIADFLYVWSSGHFLTRREGGEIQRVEIKDNKGA